MRNRSVFAVCLLLLGLGGSLPAAGQMNKKDKALVAAIWHGQLAQVQEALKHHANIEAKGSDSYTPLLLAVSYSTADIVNLLLENHANIEARLSNGFTPLLMAASDGKADMVKLLLEYHANIEAKDINGDTPLLRAAFDGHADVVKLLLENHASIDAKDSDGDTSLFWAAFHGNSDIVTLLLENHANTDTVMQWAINNGKFDLVKLLLENHANTEIKDNSGYTPLYLAVNNGNADLVKLLLENHANTEVKGSYGYTPLLLAVNNGKADLVKLLLENHANIEAKDSNVGDTPLLHAANDGNAEIVKLLLEYHANIEAKDSNAGDTPLLLAANNGNAEIVKLLLENHANIEAKDGNGYTPLLMTAWVINAPDVIELLLKSHANPQVRTSKGYNALDLAMAKLNCGDVLALEHGAQTKTQECLSALIEKHQPYVITIGLPTAVAMHPRPEVSEDARQSYVEANVTYRKAQNNDDIKSAIALYNNALMKAPWFSDAWYNLSLAQEKLGDYTAATASMKSMLPLEAGGPNERRDLDRMYTLEAEEKSSDARKQQQAQLDNAANSMRNSVGGYTMYKFFVFQRSDGSGVSLDEAVAGQGFVFASDQYGYQGHDGSPIGAQADVTTESDHVVLTLGTQRFCMPVSVADFANSSPSLQFTDRYEPGLTDCNDPPGDVRILAINNFASDPSSNKSNLQSAAPNTRTIVVLKCPNPECRPVDLTYYWLKP